MAEHREPTSRGISAALLASVALGALSTLGDWIWARFLTDGAVVPGVVHGVVFFAALALILGRLSDASRATARLLLALPVAGLLIAAAFYPLAATLGYLPALLASWVAMWMALAFARRWAERSREGALETTARGLLASLGSGLAFWAVSGMWTGSAPESWSVRFLWWTLALLPGFVALLLARRRAASVG